MLDPLIVLVALACGVASRALGLPALVGYLGAGFLLHELQLEGGELLAALSDLGIMLLLFSIGLKLQPAKLLRAQVWGTTLLHMAAMQVLFMAVLLGFAALAPGMQLDLLTGATVAFALTFSSTVFVIQVMQARGESAASHTTLAIGILIIQDLAAVVFLGVATGKTPQLTALALLLLIPLRGPLLRLLGLCGHGELFTLAGLGLALGGAALFEAVGIKGGLGVLLLGAWLSGHQKAKELGRNLLYFKDLFLVGFFLNIGLGGLPDREHTLLACLLGVLALAKPLLYFPLMTWFHTTPRTALLSAISLGNFSEFGLIVVAVAAQAGMLDPAWGATLSLAIAVSFILNAPFSARSHRLYSRWRHGLSRFESGRVRQAQPDTSGARCFVLGMGRVGTGAYQEMVTEFGEALIGVDENEAKIAAHREAGRRVVIADASNPDFWYRVDLPAVELIMLALTNHEENLRVAALLQELGYRGQLSAVVRFDEEALELAERGVSTFNLYAQAGAGFAEHAARRLRETQQS
ncbi:MAG: hypothetical protein CME59_18050 [Halioglobus sp.]|nr:hypothetical protein [Halioglobus sp.]|tara:strand:- start:2563 stop:4128 length:1566 start_codon:yes stop_codon:yes gene_type:complete